MSSTQRHNIDSKERRSEMRRWLLKTEPEEWSWEQQEANGGLSHWDGVRNAQAQNNLRAMSVGDLCFFYHSGSRAKAIVGIVRVCRSFYPDPSDHLCKHGMVDVEAVSKFPSPLPLVRLKQESGLQGFALFRQPRLSVVPVTDSQWEVIIALSDEPISSAPTGAHQAPLPDGTSQAAKDSGANHSKRKLESTVGLSDAKTGKGGKLARETRVTLKNKRY